MAIVESSKLTFKIQELPEGASDKHVELPEDYFEFDEEMHLHEAAVDVSFYRTDHFIKCSFTVNSTMELICDRSLKPFELNSTGSFDIIFEPGDVEESETAESAVRQIPTKDLVLDIDKEVRDTILLGVPTRKIHPDYLNEEGIPTEYETKKFGDIKEDSDSIDPRWEELKKLK